MEYECFDGATVFDAPDNEYVPPAQTGNRTYTFDFDCENSAILLFSKKKEKRRSTLCATQPCAGAPAAVY